jgi:antitoxin YefM
METGTTTVSYTEAREHLAELWDRVTEGRAPIRLTRRGAAPVVLVAEDEYQGLLETAHLLRSPANAARLLAALRRALAEEGTPGTVDELRRSFDGE